MRTGLGRVARAGAVTLALVLGPAGAGAQQPDAIRALGQIFANQIDQDHSGMISRSEMLRFGQEMFVSMDADTDRMISKDEMQRWEFGTRDVAIFREREQAFNTAVGLVFDMFDRSGDGGISADEMERGLLISAEYADTDGDSALSTKEFLQSFIFSIAIRNVYE